MKLTSLQIEDFRQFKNFRLDFTDPKTGQPLERVCFIGPNGTGKSTLLKNIFECAQVGAYEGGFNLDSCHCTFRRRDGRELDIRPTQGSADGAVRDLLTIFCVSDGDPPPNDAPRAFNDLPPTDLNAAIALRQNKGTKFLLGNSSYADFWKRLIFHIIERKRRLDDFQRLPENQTRTISQIDELFDPGNPQVIKELARVWNRVLALADLELDQESVELPYQLTENLKAYIRTKSGCKRVFYQDLSTGIYHYIFRLGHIWSLYFNRPQGDSLLLVDEPEGSLYPDFLYDIVENYREVAPGCQLFMATHSPIVASQFKPEERFILTFGDDGYVTARRGTSPEGDDPNDILRQDFGVGSLMTEVGERAWERFLTLRRLIPEAPEAEREPLIDECLRLQRDYNFPLPYSGAPNGKHA